MTHGRRAGRARRSTAPQQRKEILLEDQAENAKDNDPADSQPHATEAASPSSAFVSTILNILAFTAGCPSHRDFSLQGSRQSRFRALGFGRRKTSKMLTLR